MTRASIISSLATLTGSEVLTLEEVKGYLYIDYSDQDDVLTRLIQSAREYAERKTSLSIVEKDWKVVIEIKGFASKRLPFAPVNEITKVEYQSCRLSAKKDITNISDQYYSMIGEKDVVLQFGTDGVYHFEYSAGYTDAIPEDLKAAMLNYIAMKFESRGDAKKVELADDILARYKRVSWLG